MYLELMDSDLARIISSNQTLTEQHFQCFMKQILEGVRAMHQLGIFHRDLKPGNILLTKDCHVRIADLGLARFMHPSTLQGENVDKPMTHTVVTTWYRCLELLLAPVNTPYSTAVDMWSIGCIFAELMMRKAIFPGKNCLLQIQSIFQIVGYIPPEELGFPLTHEAVRYLDTKVYYEHKEWTSLIPEEFASKSALTLLAGLLTVNPSERITAESALQLQYFNNTLSYYDYARCQLPVEVRAAKIRQELTDDFFFEEQFAPLSMLQELLHDEIASCDASAYRKATAASGANAWNPVVANELSHGGPLLNSAALCDNGIRVQRQLTKAEMVSYSHRLKATEKAPADDDEAREDDIVDAGNGIQIQEDDLSSVASSVSSSLLPRDSSSKASASQQLTLRSNPLPFAADCGDMEGLETGVQMMHNPYANPNATQLHRRRDDSRSSSTSSLSSTSGLDDIAATAATSARETQPVVDERPNGAGGVSPAMIASSSTPSSSSSTSSSSHAEEEKGVFEHARLHLLRDDSHEMNKVQPKAEISAIDRTIDAASLPQPQSPNRTVPRPIEITPNHEPAKKEKEDPTHHNHKPSFHLFGMHRSEHNFSSPTVAMSSVSSASHVSSPSALSGATSHASSWSSASWSFSQDESHGKYVSLPHATSNGNNHPANHPISLTPTHKQGLGKRRLSRTGLLLKPSSTSLFSLFGSLITPATAEDGTNTTAHHATSKK
jgi:serine/threonine protein kinase